MLDHGGHRDRAPGVGYWERFGQQLAEHHRQGQGRAFGWFERQLHWFNRSEE